MRPDVDTVILLGLLTVVMLGSLVVLPLIGSWAAGLAMGGVATTLEALVIADLWKGRGDRGDGDSGGGEGGPPWRGRGGGSGVREPRRPKNKPPAARASR